MNTIMLTPEMSQTAQQDWIYKLTMKDMEERSEQLINKGKEEFVTVLSAMRAVVDVKNKAGADAAASVVADGVAGAPAAEGAGAPAAEGAEDGVVDGAGPQNAPPPAEGTGDGAPPADVAPVVGGPAAPVVGGPAPGGVTNAPDMVGAQETVNQLLAVPDSSDEDTD
jgi:hypothetical protein